MRRSKDLFAPLLPSLVKKRPDVVVESLLEAPHAVAVASSPLLSSLIAAARDENAVYRSYFHRFSGRHGFLGRFHSRRFSRLYALEMISVALAGGRREYRSAMPSRYFA